MDDEENLADMMMKKFVDLFWNVGMGGVDLEKVTTAFLYLYDDRDWGVCMDPR